MITTRSKQLGFFEPLEVLETEYQNSEILRKLRTMKNSYSGFRRIRGDGNCYYRALGFAFLESGGPEAALGLLRRLEESQNSDEHKTLHVALTEILSSCAGENGQNDTNENLNKHPLLRNKECDKYLRALYERFLVDSSLDKCLVSVVRRFVGQCVTETQNDRIQDFGTLAELLTMALGHESVEAFLEQEVLKDGVEAMDVVQIVAPKALQCQTHILQLDRNLAENGMPTIYHYPETSSAGADEKACWPDVTLLFKPGHYDILYPSEIAKCIVEVQEHGLLKKLREPWTCVVCMADETTEESIQRPWPCEHGICQPCQDGMREAGQSLDLCPGGCSKIPIFT
ncbi:unnamed protein product [Amoebophrya sp. A25]|nr:unnamed protein product [Amoebophrya sp. A25]|eukprot:GSA25T00018591001.1